MYEILDNLPDDALVLDLGSGGGSFPVDDYTFRAVLVDFKLDHLPSGRNAIQAYGHCLPFRSKSFDAVILSHVLEHEENPRRILQEVGRVLKQTGTAYIAVPDARTFTDRLYRKIFRNHGGHLSLFGSEEDLRTMVTWYLGQPHRATRILYSSFSYLNRKNFSDPGKKNEILIPPLPEALVAGLTFVVDRLDAWFGTRTGIYGWALYFGALQAEIVDQPNPNVCVRCGKAACDFDEAIKKNRRWWRLIQLYHCAQCGAMNISRSCSSLHARQ